MWFRSRELWKVNSKDHAVAASMSITTTNSATALHHYQGLNSEVGFNGAQDTERCLTHDLYRLLEAGPARLDEA